MGTEIVYGEKNYDKFYGEHDVSYNICIYHTWIYIDTISCRTWIPRIPVRLEIFLNIMLCDGIGV